jgi:hypothetical protein
VIAAATVTDPDVTDPATVPDPAASASPNGLLLQPAALLVVL